MALKDCTFTLKVTKGRTRGVEFALSEGKNYIGRWDSSRGSFPVVDLEAHDPEALVSRSHAIIDIEGGNISIEDLGSMNGTYINRSKRLEKGVSRQLKVGDEVIVGKTFLRLCQK